MVVAGGGGGAGYWSSLHVVGGVGGGLTGGNGYRDSPANPGGLGGSQTGPGANGTCISLNNTTMAGGFGYGGTPLSFSCGCEGYGGGGGWYGGAGSGNCRGGGGGSGYAIPTATNVVLNSGVRVGNGKVVISYAGPSTVTYTQISGLPSGSLFPIGTTTNTMVGSAGLGNEDTCSFTVTVIDNQAPLLTCPANVTVGTDSAQCSASNVSLGVIGIIENCAVASSTNDAPLIFPVGTTSVNYTLVDSAGNSATCSQLVTVVDDEAPVFAGCPQNISMCPGVVTYNTPTATDNCLAIVSHVSGPLSGGVLNAGTYTVIYAANDSTGNTDTCSFTITVNANPVVTLSLTSSSVCVNDGPYTLSGASPAGGTWSGTAVSGGVFTPATAGIGSYVITYNVTDANGCSGVATDSITVSPCTGINEIGAVTFSMFPNPASGSFVFNTTEHGTMEMFDVNGQLVYTSTITANKTEINVSNLATGSYMVRFTSQIGSVSTGQLLIQR